MLILLPILFIVVLAFALLIGDSFVVMRRERIEAPYVRPTPEEEDDLVHGLWHFEDRIE